jgi:hypothetical protein
MNWLDNFLESVQYSTWEAKDFPAEMGEIAEGYQIRNGRYVPIRNRNYFQVKVWL